MIRSETARCISQQLVDRSIQKVLQGNCSEEQPCATDYLIICFSIR